MQKRLAYLLIGSVALLGNVAVAALPGLAHSDAPFAVSRAQRELQGTNQIPFLLKAGDSVRAGEQFVRINGLDGETIVVDRKSAVTVEGDDRVRLMEGAMAISLPATRSVDLQVRDLRIEPLEPVAGAEEQPARFAVQSSRANEVEVANGGRMVRVTSLPDGNQVAVLGAGDTIRFARLAGGEWVPRGPSVQFSDDPTDGGESSEVKKGGLAGLFGAGSGGGAAAAAGTGTVLAGGALLGGGAVVAAATVTGGGGLDLITGEEDQNNEDDPPAEPDPTPTPRPPASRTLPAD